MNKSRWFRPSFTFFGVTSPFDSSFAFVTSPLPFLPSAALGAVRALLAVYLLVVLVVILALEVDVYGGGPSYLSYFTNLSYIGLCAYFWASSVQTIAFARVLKGLRNFQSFSNDKTEEPVRRRFYPLQKWPRALQLLHVWLYTTVMVYPFVVTIVFWALLASAETFSTSFNAFGNISRHLLNSVFVLFEISCTNVPPLSWSLLAPGFLPLPLYLGVAYITYAQQNFYTYSFLDPGAHPGRVAAYVFGIAVGYCILFVIVKGLLILRCQMCSRRERREAQGPSESLDEWVVAENLVVLSQ